MFGVQSSFEFDWVCDRCRASVVLTQISSCLSIHQCHTGQNIQVFGQDGLRARIVDDDDLIRMIEGIDSI